MIQTLTMWQNLGAYDHEVEATYKDGTYVQGSMRYTGRTRSAQRY